MTKRLGLPSSAKPDFQAPVLSPTKSANAEKKIVDSQLFSLALPLLATLVVEPLLVATDSTFVGHLGRTELAGLTIASTVLSTVLRMCVFLSFATTAMVAKAFGANNPRVCLKRALEGMWFGFTLGIILGALLFVFAAPIVQFFGADAAVTAPAVAYLQASAPGLPSMLIVLAAAGSARGMSDTRTPLFATLTAALINIPLCYLLIFNFHFSVAGAGISTAICQTLMALWLGGKIVHRAWQEKISLKPEKAGFWRQTIAAWPLLIRNSCINLVLVLQVAIAAQLGSAQLAAYQLVASLWFLAGFALDALASAAMILIGQGLGLGRGNEARVRTILDRCLWWGIISGAGVGLGLALILPWITPLMSSDTTVATLALHAMLIICLTFPLMSVAFMLDGALLGAADTVTLAVLMPATLLTYLPGAAIIFGLANNPAGNFLLGNTGHGLVWLWLNYAVFHIGARALVTYLRTRKNAWMKLEINTDELTQLTTAV